MLIPVLFALLQAAAPQDTLPGFRPDSADMATAYADPATRELVRLARERREALDASLFRYRAEVQQRISVGVRALRRDRLVYRREMAALVHWSRDEPARVEVLGAREAVPMAIPGLSVPDDLESSAISLLLKPGDSQLILDVVGGGFAWHPLVDGGEEVYTYAIGDSTRIRLPDGRSIRLVELRVTPRERDVRLITGSFWIEMDDHAIVQAVYRPSREFDLERDLPVIDPDDDGADDVPDILKPIRMDFRYMTVEYGLWEMRWWMPRLVLLDGHLQVGPAEFPISYEIRYSDYSVEADRHGLPALPPLTLRLAGDSTARARPIDHGTTVVVADTADLLDSELLPHSLYDDTPLVTDAEIRELGERLGGLPPVPWAVERPRVTWPWQLGRGLLRYNRVEGLSAGARVDLDLGRANVDLTGRLGTADLAPRAELGVEVPTLRRTWRLAAYRRLAAVDPAVASLDLGSSLNALLVGRDDGSYFSATGMAIEVRPAPGEGRWGARLYAERQADVDRNTSFSLPHLLDDERRFRPNIEADDADQLGIAATAEATRGLDPRGFRWSLRLDATAETGDYTFVRPGLTGMTAFPLPGRWLGALEAAGGTTFGTGEGRGSPVQSQWMIGGPRTLRGFGGGAAAGPDYARARAEAATSFPAARLAIFTDAGWAGDFATFHEDDLLVSAGIGASFLDGLLRIDLARTLQPGPGWRLESYVDGLF